MTEILILDYNKPNELKELLLSIKEKAKFDKKVVVLNNGGEKYADEFLKEGLCDKVIHNKINIGCGAATVQLFSQCTSVFAFYVQVDQKLICEINEDYIQAFQDGISSGEYFYIDLAGNQCQGKYSERAHFIRRNDYLCIPKEFGGVGPLADQKWTEECVQNFMEQHNLTFCSVRGEDNNPLFLDCGWDSVRENPDGSKWIHHPDTKLLKCIQKPTEKFVFPPFNDEEWEQALKGEWPKEGAIPKEWEDNSFEVWNKI